MLRAEADLTIRPVQDGDTPGVQALIARIFDDYGYILDVEREDPHLRAPGEYFRSHGGECWVATRGGRVVAVGAVTVNGETAELKTVYVDHAERGQGLGTRLTTLAIEHARSAAATRMILWSDTLFIEAHRMYEKLGFRRCGLREMRLTNIFSEYQFEMELALTAKAGHAPA